MISREVKIQNPTGLHLRPAGMLCKEAARYEECSIKFQVANKTGNAKSVLSVLAAGIKQGDVVEIICDGKDEEQILDTIVHFIEEKLED